MARALLLIALTLMLASAGAACDGDARREYVITVTFLDFPERGGLEDVSDTLKSYAARYDADIEVRTEIVRPPRIIARFEADREVCEDATRDLSVRPDVASVTCDPA
jgi:hypothetical protein